MTKTKNQLMDLRQLSQKPETISAIMTLPETLTDGELRRLQEIAGLPVPRLSPCPPGLFADEMSRMRRNLSIRRMDVDVGRSLVTDYAKVLGEYPSEAITWMVDQAIRTLSWFPDLKWCLDTLKGWKREDVALQAIAKSKAERELHRRLEDARMGIRFGKLSQGKVDELPDWIKAKLIEDGSLGPDGKIRPSAVWVRDEEMTDDWR